MDKWWKTLDKAGDERGTRGDKRDLCQDCLRLFHTAGIMKGRNRWGALLGMLVSDGAGDGVREGSHPLALSRGAILVRISVSDGAGAGVLVKNLASDEAGEGRSAPLHPLGGRDARGCDPLALSHGAVLVKISVSDGAGSSVPARNLISGEAEHSLVGLIWWGFGFSTELVRAFW